MASLKEIKTKISGVKKTRQITKAMNMVAASKLRGAQTAMEAFRPYAEKFASVLASVAAKSGDDASPLLVPREEVKRVHVVLCTSDRGLCGGFNTHLIETAEGFIETFPNKEASFSLTCFGKKGRDWANKMKLEISEEYLNIVGTRFGFEVVVRCGQRLIDEFLSGKIDEAYVIFSKFISMGTQAPTITKLLPIAVAQDDSESEVEDKPYQAEHIYEPSAAELLATILPKNVYVQLYDALLETSTSEHAARMRAMDNATKACNDMIESLTLAFNKARQAAITTELMDIVGGAEALRG